MKNNNDHTGNRTHYPPICSAMPHSTASVHNINM